MKKIGIVGAGNIAKAHARALSTIKGAELSGVYDLHESVAQDSLNSTADVCIQVSRHWQMHLMG